MFAETTIIERQLLGVVLVRPSLLGLVPNLQVDDFRHPHHQAVFTAIRNVEAASQPITMDTVRAKLPPAFHGEHSADIGHALHIEDLALDVLDPASDDGWATRAVVENAKVLGANRERIELALWEEAEAEASAPKSAGKVVLEELRAIAATLPEIVVSKDIAADVDAAERALVQLGGVWVRGGSLVQVVRDVEESRGLHYPEGSPVVRPIRPARLRELVNSSATWVAYRKATGKNKKGTVKERVVVPPHIPSTLADRGEWKLSPLDGVSEAPILRADGSVCDQPGYDAASRMLYDPGAVKWPSIPASPSRTDAARALAELLEPFDEFAFVGVSDRAAVAAFILTMVGRPAIAGVTPMVGARATTPGSGKGLMFDAAAIIATGRQAPTRAPAANDEELRKALISYALEAPAVIVIDNVAGSLGSPVLAMITTAGVISDRLLAKNETRSVPVRFVIAATGNNLSFRGDLPRRVVPIDLDPGVEHPEDRRFQRADLLGYVRGERERLYVAALTTLRAFIVAGKPAHPKPALGSYVAWDELVRGTVVWALGVDPVAGQERIREDGDDEREQHRALLHAWRGEFGKQGVSVAAAVTAAKRNTTGALYAALGAYCRTGEPDAKQLGYVVRRLRGRIADGLKLRLDSDGHQGIKTWKVESGGDGGHGGDISNPSRERVFGDHDHG